MRIIDADELIKKWENVHCKDISFEMAVIGAINDVKKAQTVDAVQVVRCKDCRYYYPAEYDKKGNTCLLLYEMIHAPLWVKEDDYCSKGVSADNGKERTV